MAEAPDTRGDAVVQGRTDDESWAAYGLNRKRQSLAWFGVVVLFIYGAIFPASFLESGGVSTVVKVVFVSVGCTVLCLAIYAGIRVAGRKDLRVIARSDGLVYTRNKKTVKITWDEVESFRLAISDTYVNGVYTGRKHSYAIRTADGRRYKFGNFVQNVEELGARIQEETAKHILPRLEKAFEAGETVGCARLGVNKGGVTMGGRTLPLNEVALAEFEKGKLVVRRNSKGNFIDEVRDQGVGVRWGSIPVRSIPNAACLVALINRKG